ncbi:MAG TPA: hydantoinase/oxoprolinase family protein [Candidatus Binataceae bacterium]|nr:hydantoinase/oxoprolinase family protein [Candidatus Binataceae bacterium]
MSASRRTTARRTPIVIGVDTGGTFTDVAAMVGGELRMHKLLSTPHDPAAAVLEGVRALLGDSVAESLTYSSTVATNALLERRGARVALFTNAGFEDLIEIGRQNRSDIYALAPARPQPLVARAMRFGIAERTLFDGQIALEPSTAELKRIANIAARTRAQSFAVCLLHSYANSRSEEAVATALKRAGRPLSVSHRILPEYREFERLSTTVVNAYVAPLMGEHLGRLERELPTRRLRIMQSDGNAIGADLARLEPVRTILSGPAAGVMGAGTMGRAFGVSRFITFDMGGTSTDVSLFDGRANVRSLSYPAGYPVRTPVIDIHTVGAGGGSLARVDEGGSLKVGPQSAGADPGPACYGRGEEPTVTDADLIAGRIIADNFLGGRMRLYPERAARAVGRLSRAMKCPVNDAALGILRVVNANMARAVRLITVERGFDPRDFALLAFGGAGPMHACDLADELGIRHVILPGNPGLACAYGALKAALGREYSLTVRRAAPSHAEIGKLIRPLIVRAHAEMAAQGVSRSKLEIESWADLRYRGQSFELKVPMTPRFLEDFHRAHERSFGYAARGAMVELVNLRLVARAREYTHRTRRIPRAARTPAPIDHIGVLAEGRRRKAPVYRREDLGAGIRLRGPLLMVEMSATAYVAPGFTMRVDDYGNIHLEARE